MSLNKSIIIMALAVVVAGIVIACNVGLNVDMQNNEHNQVLLNLDKEYNLADVMEITKEVFVDKTVDNQKAGENNKQVLISASEITEEEKTNLVNKVNEKFGTTIEASSVDINLMPRTKITSTVSPYIFPVILIIVLVGVYYSFRYKELGILKVIGQYLIGLAIMGLLTFSIISVARIQMGMITVSVLFTGITVFIFAITSYFEKNLKNHKILEENNNK